MGTHTPGNLYQGKLDDDGNRTGDFTNINGVGVTNGFAAFRFNTNVTNQINAEPDVPLTHKYYFINDLQGENGAGTNSTTFDIIPVSPNYFTPSSCSPPLRNSAPVEKLEETATQAVPDDEGAKFTALSAKINLRKLLAAVPAYRDSSLLLENFDDSVAIANIGAYVTVKEQMALLADSALLSDSASLAAFVTTALSLNSALSGSEEYSSNQKQFNELFLGFLASGRIFTGADSVNLFDLASQCLYSGGPGVMEARALYNLIDRRYYFNDRALCSLMGGGASRKAGETTAKEKLSDVAGVYPNPNTGMFNVALSDKAENGLIVITDIAGRLISRKPLAADALITTISLEVSPGSYFYIIKGNGKIIKNGKLVIVK